MFILCLKVNNWNVLEFQAGTFPNRCRDKRASMLIFSQVNKYSGFVSWMLSFCFGRAPTSAIESRCKRKVKAEIVCPVFTSGEMLATRRVHCSKVMWIPEEIHKQVVWWGLRNNWCPNLLSGGCFFVETVLTLYIQLVIQKVVFAARWDCFIQYFQETLGKKSMSWE